MGRVFRIALPQNANPQYSNNPGALQAFPKRLGFIIHKGETKDPGPDQFIRIAEQGNEVFVVSEVNDVSSQPPVPGAVKIQNSAAHWVTKSTVLYKPAASTGVTKTELLFSPDGTLKTGVNGFEGSYPTIVLGAGSNPNLPNMKPTCIDCHGVHNIQNPTTARFRNETPQLCAKCHTDPARMSKYGITTDVLNTYVADFHGTTVTLFEQVSPDTPTNKPVCTDCHGAHRVGPAALADTLDGVPCKDCHKDIFTAYRASIHGMRKDSGAGKPPLCAGCHHAHDVKPATASRSPRDMCLSCHPQIIASHQQWLPNPQAHLEMVACTACHVAVNDKRSIYLRPTDDETKKLLPDAEVRKLLDAHGIAGRPIEPADLWWLAQKLNEGRTVSIAVAVSPDDPVHAHDITTKDQALRTCEGCHSTDSSFYDTVAIATAGK